MAITKSVISVIRTPSAKSVTTEFVDYENNLGTRIQAKVQSDLYLLYFYSFLAGVATTLATCSHGVGAARNQRSHGVVSQLASKSNRPCNKVKEGAL
jgi:hypothetical protein